MVKQQLDTPIQDVKVILLLGLLIILPALVLGYIISLDPDWLRLGFDLTRPKYLFGLIVGLIAVLVVLKWPEVGLLGLAAISFSNASEVLVSFHSLPSLLQLLVPLLIITIVVHTLILQRKRFISDPMIVLLLIYAALILLSSSRAVNTSLADQRLFEFSKNLLIFLIVINLISSRYTLRHTAWVLLLVGAFLGTISVYQVITSSYGFEFGGFGRIKIAHISGSYWKPRITGPLADANFYAQILLVFVSVAIYRLWDESSLRLKVISAYALSVLLLAMVFTYSRGGTLALGLVLFLTVIHKRVKLRNLIFLLLILSLMIIFIPNQFKGRLSTLEELIPGRDESKIHLDSSFRQRILYMKTAWEMFSDNPFLGVGAGNYSEHYDQYSKQVGSIVSSYEHFGKPRLPHNLYLQIASETGLIGFVIFMSIISLTLWYYYSAYNKFKEGRDYHSASIVISLMFGFVGYLITSLFLHGDYIRYFWLLVAIAVAAKHIATNNNEIKIRNSSVSNSLPLVNE